MNQRIRNCAAAAALLLTAMTAMTASATNYTAILTGPQESPPNTSPAIGAAIVKFDPASHMLEVDVAFSGLVLPSTLAHIHCCTTLPGAGIADVATEVPTFGGFPMGVTTGAYINTYDTSLPASWNPAFLSSHGGTTAGAEAAFAAGLDAGAAYLNIHSFRYPGGEIRGFLISAPVPEPATVAMLGLGVPAVLLMARRRRKT